MTRNILRFALFIRDLLYLLFIAADTSSDEDVWPEWSETDKFDVRYYFPMTKKSGKDFRILQLADVHLGGKDSDDRITFNIIRDAVYKNNPDLLVLTGDNVCNVVNYEAAARLIAFLDTLQTPYSLVMGNHDGDGMAKNTKIGRIYGAGKYSLFTRGPSNIPGCGNYGINIFNEAGEVIYSLMMMDSNRYCETGYDSIHPEQIEWYEWYINGISDIRFGKGRTPDEVVKSLMFFHIPLPEINDIRRHLKATDSALEQLAFLEDPCPPKENSGMFQKIKKLQSTTHIFNGHDHRNLLNYEWDGVHFVYGLKTGPQSYHDDERMGTTLITIKDDLSVDVEFLLIGAFSLDDYAQRLHDDPDIEP